MIQTLFENFHTIGSSTCMTFKLHFLWCHLELFPANFAHYSEDKGKKFHQDIKSKEQRYQGKWNACWLLLVYETRYAICEETFFVTFSYFLTFLIF